MLVKIPDLGIAVEARTRKRDLHVIGVVTGIEVIVVMEVASKGRQEVA
jgi:hypothetical protein